MRIIHIINPVKTSTDSDLYIAQPITFESLKIAKENYRNDVIQCSAQFSEDLSIIPDHIKITRNLKRSVADLGNDSLNRKLPLIKDILRRAYRISKKGDYCIYTNVDIALQPEFYNWVHHKINEGLDAFIINRRTISSHYKDPSELPLMYEESGSQHPGYDCFVFRRELIKKMILENVCIGAAYIGLALFLNIKLLSKNFIEFTDEYLTFHIGDDQVWKKPENNPFAIHNKNEFDKIKRKFKKRFKNVDELIESAFPTLKSSQ